VKNVFDAEHCGEKTDRQTDVQTDRQNYCKISNVCKTEEYILHLMHLFFHRKFKLTMRIRVIVTFSGFFLCITPFKVIQDDSCQYQSKACKRLPIRDEY